MLIVTIQNFSTSGPLCISNTSVIGRTVRGVLFLRLPECGGWQLCHTGCNQILELSATSVPHPGSLPKAIHWALWYGFLLDLQRLTAFCRDNTFQWQLSAWYLQWQVLEEYRVHSMQVDLWPWSSRSWLSACHSADFLQWSTTCCVYVSACAWF